MSLAYRPFFHVRHFHFLYPVITKRDKLFIRKILRIRFTTYLSTSVFLSRTFPWEKLPALEPAARRFQAILTLLTGRWTRRSATHDTDTGRENTVERDNGIFVFFRAEVVSFDSSEKPLLMT